MTKRTSAKYKIDRRMGENIWGRPKSPVNKREYGPGQHGQRRKGKMSRLRHPAPRQAEAQGLLRRPDREAVPPHLRRGRAAARRHLGAPDRAPGAPARRGGLPREVRADDLRGAAVREPRPRRGERPAGQHRLLPRQGRRRRQRARQVAAAGAGARGDRLAGARRARNTSPSTTPSSPPSSSARRRSRDVPYPVMMEPNLVVEYYAKN